MAADVKQDNQGPDDRPVTQPPGDRPAEAEAAAAGSAPDAEPGTEPPVDLTAETDALQAEVDRLKEELLRALAETENVRKRAARDKADTAKYAVSGFARDLLPVADNLRRALSSVDDDVQAREPALQALVAGVEMTEKALLAVFERHGITPIAAEGERFNPHVHEAMFEIPNETVPNGTVLQVLEQGFMIHDRPLRPARVGVSRGGPKAPPGAERGGEGPAEGEPPAAPSTRAGTAAYDGAGPGANSAGANLDEKS
ncbi:MAG: nucleotide exchange factor GrpE [Rhodospirillales bacterium]|nr:MAG: nucleotide exchange factor GrpE [Rhodospirillales bacterium]